MQPRKKFYIVTTILTLGFALLFINQPRFVHAFPTGVVGWSGNPATNSGLNCNGCHGGGMEPTVVIDAPASVAPGQTALLTLTISGGQEAGGGFNISATNGQLANLAGATDTQIVFESDTGMDEATHTMPKVVDNNGEVSFQIEWTAPTSPGTVTIYGAGNSVNLNGSGSGDAAASATTDIEVGGGSAELLYFVLDGTGTLFGIDYTPQDVLIYDASGPSVQLWMDGSDVGLGDNKIDAFDILPDGRAVISLEMQTFGLPGLGTLIEPTDLLLFDPKTTGDNTFGLFTTAFDGSDVGLDATTENVDGFSLTGPNSGWLSTTGSFTVPGLSGDDSDIIRFDASNVGPKTSGTFSLAAAGTDIDLTTFNEDVDGLFRGSGDLFLSTLSTFDVPGLSGDGNDIFVCTPTGNQPITSCDYDPMLYANASLAGISDNIIAFSVETGIARNVSWSND